MQKRTKISLQLIAELANCRLVGNPNHNISGVADLETATNDDASFFSNPRYYQALQLSKAGVIFVDPTVSLLPDRNYLISEQPSEAFQSLLDKLFPQRTSPSGFVGIHPSAIVHASSTIAEDVCLGPNVVIDEEVSIGKGTFIGSGSYIGPGTQVGENCIIHNLVTLRENCVIGNRVILQPGVVIGSCGFGYLTNAKGQHVKLNQVGRVVIQDDVEVGANTTIDRGRFDDTILGLGTKIDNLVQIGHGVHIGPYNIIVAQTGFAGSSSTGKYVVIAGQAAVAGHLHLEDRVKIAARSVVTKNLSSGSYSGHPAVPFHKYQRNQVFLRNIEKYVDELKDLKARVDKLSD